jgi:hypothetical protein
VLRRLGEAAGGGVKRCIGSSGTGEPRTSPASSSHSRSAGRTRTQISGWVVELSRYGLREAADGRVVPVTHVAMRQAADTPPKARP